jgi:hypothetical protein
MKEAEAKGQKDCGPDETTYKRVITAWLNSKHPDADREIAALRKEMKILAEKRRNVRN